MRITAPAFRDARQGDLDMSVYSTCKRHGSLTLTVDHDTPTVDNPEGKERYYRG